MLQKCNLCQVLPDELEEIINNEEFVIIDVRTPAEYSQYKLKRSVLIPMNEVPGKVEYFKELAKEKKILVYCHSGNRSDTVARFLMENGIPIIYNLQYGIMYAPKHLIEF